MDIWIAIVRSEGDLHLYQAPVLFQIVCGIPLKGKLEYNILCLKSIPMYLFNNLKKYFNNCIHSHKVSVIGHK